MRVISVLSRLSGMALDQGYIDSQVAGHTKALDLLDGLLIPNAMHTQLVQDLHTTRSAVLTHLTRAREIQNHMVGLD